MPERSNRAVLTSLRAAAIIIIATGLNEVIAGAIPRYEPLYIYLGAIALVVLLDGVFLGAVTAVVAIAFYALLYMPRPAALSPAVLVPLGWAFGVVALAAVARGILRSRARRSEMPEIFQRDVLPAMAEQSGVLSAIDDLRAELREREVTLQRSYLEAREGLTARLHVAEEELARLSQLLDAERAERQRLDTAARLAESDARALADAARRDAHTARADADVLRRDAESMRARMEAATHAVEMARAEADALRREADAARGDAALARREAEAAGRETEAARNEAEVARAEVETIRAEAGAARQAEAEARTLAEKARRETAAARTETEAARIAGERFRADAQQLQTQIAAAHVEAAARAADLVSLRAGADELRKTLEVERARSEGERTLRTTAVERLTELDREAVRTRERMAILEQAVAEERSLRERLELDAGTRDAAAAALRARIRELEQTLESARLRAAEEERRLQEALAALEGSNERRGAEVETLRARIAELERSLDSTSIGAAEERALRERVERAAQASLDDASLLRIRIAELEQALADVTAANDEAAARASAEFEEAGVRANAEFDQKLNTIVTHLAADHEADLGKAMEEREEARAEARSLGMRVKRAEDEKQVLLGKALELEERYRRSIEDSTRLLEQTRSAAQGEIDRLHGRVVELEHGIARGLRAAPAVKPVVRPRVLVAHPDADLLMSARASLERAGYEVVSAVDGLEALRTAIAQRPDVVIADAIMPKMNGRELCQLLKSQEKTAHIRVVLLLRATDEAPRGDLVPDEVLRKPVPLETLKSTLAGLLASRQ